MLLALLCLRLVVVLVVEVGLGVVACGGLSSESVGAQCTHACFLPGKDVCMSMNLSL